MVIYFHGERGPTLSKVKHLQYQMEGVLFLVRFAKISIVPASRAENVWLWRKWDLC